MLVAAGDEMSRALLLAALSCRVRVREGGVQMLNNGRVFAGETRN